MLRTAMCGFGFVLVAAGLHPDVSAQPAPGKHRVGYIQTATPDEQATTTIPVVMTTGRDPVGAGFVASLARPGGNVTGLATDPALEALGKALEILKEIVPHAARIALLWNPVPPGTERVRSIATDAAGRSGVALQVVEVRSREDFEAAFAAMAREQSDALWVLPDPLTFTARSQVVALAARHRLHAVFWQREFVEAGGLVSYGSNVAELFRRAASYVDRILKGSKPADLAIEQASKFALVINRDTARDLGLAIPRSLLLRADAIIP